MLEMSTRVAFDAARLLWQGASTIVPQVGVWFAANKTGDFISWALGKRNVDAEHKVAAAENKVAAAEDKLEAAQNVAAEKSGFFSRLNPLSLIKQIPILAPFKKLNPVSLISFAISPLLSVSRAASWFLYQGFGLAKVLQKPMQAFSPIAEKFLTPILEKAVRPVLNYLTSEGYLQLPKPDVVCPEVVCPTLPQMFCETAPTIIEQASKLQETGSVTSKVLNFLQINLLNLGETTATSAPKIPMEQVFEQVVQDIPTPAVEEIIKTAEPVAEMVKQRIPQTYFELTEHYAEPAGRFIAGTLSSAYHGVAKIVQKPADIVNATSKSIDVMADGIGIPRQYFIGAAVGVAGCYGLYSWYHARRAANQAKAEARAESEARARSEAEAQANANANARAQGGAAHATVNLILSANGQGPALPINGASSLPAIAATPGSKFKPQ